jgi:hypothetical protein
MLWYLLLALIVFTIAVFSAYFHAHAAPTCRSVRLNRGALFAMTLLSFASFYPILIGYFRLYPVSSPTHFMLTISTMLLALNGLLISLFPRRLVNFHTQGWRRKQIVLIASVALVAAVVSGWLLRADMASGSLLSWWSPLFLVLFVVEAFCCWSLLLQIPAQLRTRNQLPASANDESFPRT